MKKALNQQAEENTEMSTFGRDFVIIYIYVSFKIA